MLIRREFRLRLPESAPETEDGDRMLVDGYLDTDGVQNAYFESQSVVQAVLDLTAGRLVPEVIKDPGFGIHQGNLKEIAAQMWGANVRKYPMPSARPGNPDSQSAVSPVSNRRSAQRNRMRVVRLSRPSPIPNRRYSRIHSCATWLPLALLLAAGLTPGPAAAATDRSPPEFLSDTPERILSARQDWGVLGFNTAAHAPDRTPQPLQVGSTLFEKGLGHHANGNLVVWLDGAYDLFESDIGLQPAGDDSGSVVFRVFVDGKPGFESGTVRARDPARPIRVEVRGAHELRLEATDAGDGITCDMANWLNARLTPASTAGPPADRQESHVNLAPFARVVSWDPNRNHGTRANRLEEFPAADLFLESDLPRRPDGSFAVPIATNGLACVGLEWLSRRALREVILEFANPADVPAADRVRLEGWLGESRWQGEWHPLEGEWFVDGPRLGRRLSLKSPARGVLQTWKVRWILPASGPDVVVRKLEAFTRSRWTTSRLLVHWEKPAPAPRNWRQALEPRLDRCLDIVNGQILEPAHVRWDDRRPQLLTVRHSQPSTLPPDPTVLQIRLPWGAAGIAVQDLLEQPCVYLPDLGVLISRANHPVTPAQYRRQIQDRPTRLEQVRQSPDQTLEQALVHTHHAAQNEGPVLLSLPCDNTKYILERNGDLRFPTTAQPGDDWLATAGTLQLQWSGQTTGKRTRQLEGGWLPLPVITTETQGVVLRQRTFVAPLPNASSDGPGPLPAGVCVTEFSLSNSLPGPTTLDLRLDFRTPQNAPETVRLQPGPQGYSIRLGPRPLGWISTHNTRHLQSGTRDNTLTIAGSLPPQSTAAFALFLAPQAPECPSTPPSVNDLRSATVSCWEKQLAPAMQFEIPDPFLDHLIRSSQVRCLIDARNEANGTRIAPWIAAMSYGPLESEAHSVIRGMDVFGHTNFARRGLDYFIHRYHTNGFLTTGYTTFGTAWHLWTLGEHLERTANTNWLQQIAPELARVGHWILRQTQKTQTGRSPLPDTWAALIEYLPPNPDPVAAGFGLMPPGVLADWNSFAVHFTMNAYYCAALRELGNALANTHPAEAAAFANAALDLRDSLLRAYRWTQAQAPALPLHNGTWIPHYPSQLHSPGPLARFFPGDDAGRAWAYDVELGAHQLVPTGVLDPHAREVSRMLDHLEDVHFLGEGWFDYPAAENARDWFNLGGFAKVQPYYARNCEIYALRDDVKPFLRSYFNSLASLVNREVMTFWEHFRHSGAWDKTHETGYFLHQSRTLLLTERRDSLWLAPFLPRDWLRDGRTVAVRNAPTRFGPVSFRIDSHLNSGWIEAQVEPPTRCPPQSIVLRLRLPEGRSLRSVKAEGAEVRLDKKAETITLHAPRSLARLRVQVR